MLDLKKISAAKRGGGQETAWLVNPKGEYYLRTGLPVSNVSKLGTMFQGIFFLFLVDQMSHSPKKRNKTQRFGPAEHR